MYVDIFNIIDLPILKPNSHQITSMVQINDQAMSFGF